MGKKVIITSIVLICIMLLIYLCIPAVAIWGESMLVRFEIQNSYVNGGFRGWNRVRIEDVGAFLIPKGWSLEVDDDIYWIIDDSGEAWAFGAIFGTDGAPFANYKDLITAVQGIPCSKIEIDPFSGFLMMNGSDIDVLRLHGDTSDSSAFCIQMFVDTQKELVWMLLPDLSIDKSEFDIAEAIVYSFAFDIKRGRYETTEKVGF